MSRKKSTLAKKCTLLSMKRLNCYQFTAHKYGDVRSIYIFRKFVFM